MISDYHRCINNGDEWYGEDEVERRSHSCFVTEDEYGCNVWECDDECCQSCDDEDTYTGLIIVPSNESVLLPFDF